ncbi:hypothetical protein [Legionella cincinnatiensis]|uniref:Uncharacterized protein n=1 Tax=Legionella cincinnatiensis TaxID=28085 RepID=A0A378IFF6_9GAMM|nr:hypothetical protein [Legionella cincinnatiensis]KTC92222.1 hypothetical protein Lcin_1001 [Legionella cincinnatiensis]STX33475.1 Uncharacterised protein [Legionella cincinnatiensis]
MNFKIQLVVDDDQGQITSEDIIELERTDHHFVGFSLIESKALLGITEKHCSMPSIEIFQIHNVIVCVQKSDELRDILRLSIEPCLALLLYPAYGYIIVVGMTRPQKYLVLWNFLSEDYVVTHRKHRLPLAQSY